MNGNTVRGIADQLRESLPGSGVSVAVVGEDLVEISDSSSKPGRSIRLYVRDECDVDMAFHVPERRGSPFEQVFVGFPDEAEAVQENVVRFVGDLVAERVVLAMDDRLSGGGRQFIAASEMSVQRPARWSWLVSWRGTYDSDTPAG